MAFSLTDWLVIAGYLLFNLLIGLYYRSKAGNSTEDFFISGRDVSWWLAGTSMVATTFAADTPLLVCGLVATQGISGNWIWWSFCLSGMTTVFFFARYWRRAEILTDVELVEIRYGGKPAAFLRGFKAIYLGLLMNCFILGWVTRAMVDIISVVLGPMIAQGRVLTLTHRRRMRSSITRWAIRGIPRWLSASLSWFPSPACIRSLADSGACWSQISSSSR